MSFSMDKELADKFKKIIEEEEKNASKVVANLLKDYIEKYVKKKNN